MGDVGLGMEIKKKIKVPGMTAVFILFLLASLVGCSSGSSSSSGCCKVCTQGKACGDTCISNSYNCNTPPGCACNG